MAFPVTSGVVRGWSTFFACMKPWSQTPKTNDTSVYIETGCCYCCINSLEISWSQFISGKIYVVHDIRNWRFIKYFKKALKIWSSSWILVTNVPLVFHIFLVYLFSCILISNSRYAVMIFPLEELQASNLDSLKWRMDSACKIKGGELERYIQR